MSAKALHDFISHNCLYCQSYGTCKKLVELREAADRGEAATNGRCAEFRDVNGPILDREASDKERLDIHPEAVLGVPKQD